MISSVHLDTTADTNTKNYKSLWRQSIKRVISNLRSEKQSEKLSERIKRFNTKSIVMRRVIDDISSDNTSTQIPKTIIDPNSVKKGLWDLIIGIVMLYVSIVTPLSMAFLETNTFDVLFWVDVTIDAIFALDVILNLNTYYLDEEGNIIVKRKEIFLNYLRGWLIVDIFTCIPFEILQLFTGGYSATNKLARMTKLRVLPRLFRVARLLKMVKHVRSSSFVQQLQLLFSLSHRIMQVLTMFTGTIICIHVIACFWYFVAKMNDFNSETWISRYKFEDKEPGYLYLCSVYWAITTLTSVGYGDIVPKTQEEKAVAMCWMVFSVYFLSFIVGSISLIISELTEKTKFRDSLLAKADSFADESGINKELRNKITNYISRNSDSFSAKVTDKSDLIQYFNSDIKLELVQSIHDGAFAAFEIFNKQGKDFLMRIIPLLDTIEYPPRSVIYSVGEHSCEIYFLLKGKVHHKHENNVFRVDNPGSYFGDYEMFKRISREYTVTAVMNTYLWVMKEKIVDIIIEEFPGVYKEMIQNSICNYKKTKAALAEITVLKRMKGKSATETRKSISEKYESMLKEGESLDGRIQFPSLRFESEIDNLIQMLKYDRRVMKAILKNLSKLGC